MFSILIVRPVMYVTLKASISFLKKTIIINIAYIKHMHMNANPDVPLVEKILNVHLNMCYIIVM